MLVLYVQAVNTARRWGLCLAVDTNGVMIFDSVPRRNIRGGFGA